MNYERYEFVVVSEDFQEFRFQSVGPKGMVSMIIQFQEMASRIYNLAYGELEDGCINDQKNNQNNDRNKILATVAAAVFEFTAAFPGRGVYFAGSTPSRCRLYRMAINIHFAAIEPHLDVYGIRRIDNRFKAEPFLKDVDYLEFFVERKLK
jgi:hypothetical protein